MSSEPIYRVSTFHHTQVFVNQKKLVHKDIGDENDLPLFAIKREGGVIFLAMSDETFHYVTAIKNDLTIEFGTEPKIFPVVNNPNGSISISIGKRFLSARREEKFLLASKNLSWEHFTLTERAIEHEAIVVCMNTKALAEVLLTLNLNKVRIVAVLREGASGKTRMIEGRKVPILPLRSIEKVLNGGKKCLWLLSGWPDNGVGALTRMRNLLVEEGVPQENVINFVIKQHITRAWLGNVKYVEKHPVDFFATGISYAEVGLDFDRLVGAGGINLSNSNQDLRQAHLIAEHVFKHQSSIKFVLIGLAPYAFRYENQKAFSVCTRNVQFMLGLPNCPPATEHDKLLLSLLSDRVKRIFSSASEKDADLNYFKTKQATNKDIPLDRFTDWEKESVNVNKKFYPETFERNVSILEDYIKLCLENGAKPIGVVLPFAPIIRRHYSEDLLIHFRQVLHSLERAYDFRVIDLFDLPLGYDCFYNMAHLNRKGAALASAELNRRLHESKILPLKDALFDPYEQFIQRAKRLNKDIYNDLLDKTLALSVEQIKRKDRIKVGFVTYDASMWSGDELYRLFERNERYEPKVFLCLRRDQNQEATVIRDFRHGLDQFRSRGLNVVGVENDQTPIEQQDVLIFLTPYLNVLPNAFHLERLTAKTLLAYIPYAMQVSATFAINKPLMFVAWKLFWDKAHTLKLFDEKCPVGMPRGLYSGHPKLDDFFSEQPPFEWKEARPNSTRIIWAPHWSINSGVLMSTFQWNFKFFYEYARAHPETSWVVKPHPNLLFSAVKDKLFPSVEAFEEYLAQWDALLNAKVETGGYYRNIFASSDGMILDSASFRFEYQYTHKPMLFLTREYKPSNSLSEELSEVIYNVDGRDHAGIANFIEKVLIEKNDPMREARRAFFDKHLNYVRDNGMLASEFIFNAIDKELRR